MCNEGTRSASGHRPAGDLDQHIDGALPVQIEYASCQITRRRYPNMPVFSVRRMDMNGVTIGDEGWPQFTLPLDFSETPELLGYDVLQVSYTASIANSFSDDRYALNNVKDIPDIIEALWPLLARLLYWTSKAMSCRCGDLIRESTYPFRT